MVEKRLSFALFGNVYQQNKSAAVRQLIDCLQQRGGVVMIDEEYRDYLIALGVLEGTECEPFTELPACDFVVSMGGDGTLLKTASRVAERQIPIVGVNMGRLGFLADVSAHDIETAVDALFRGEYSVEKRALISVESDGDAIEGCPCALNDVAILKRDTASMITIRASIDGDYLATYQADGLIVSTPTGSTAYSLSNGGPVIVPGTGVLLLTPVAPHSLNVRPIVIPGSSVIELTVSSRSHTFLVAVDGRSQKMPEGTTLRLQRAPYVTCIVKRSGSRYFTTLREKMMWGADVR